MSVCLGADWICQDGVHSIVGHFKMFRRKICLLQYIFMSMQGFLLHKFYTCFQQLWMAVLISKNPKHYTMQTQTHRHTLTHRHTDTHTHTHTDTHTQTHTHTDYLRHLSSYHSPFLLHHFMSTYPWDAEATKL